MRLCKGCRAPNIISSRSLFSTWVPSFRLTENQLWSVFCLPTRRMRLPWTALSWLAPSTLNWLNILQVCFKTTPLCGRYVPVSQQRSGRTKPATHQMKPKNTTKGTELSIFFFAAVGYYIWYYDVWRSAYCHTASTLGSSTRNWRPVTSQRFREISALGFGSFNHTFRRTYFVGPPNPKNGTKPKALLSRECELTVFDFRIQLHLSYSKNRSWSPWCWFWWPDGSPPCKNGSTHILRSWLALVPRSTGIFFVVCQLISNNPRYFSPSFLTKNEYAYLQCLSACSHFLRLCSTISVQARQKLFAKRWVLS